MTLKQAEKLLRMPKPLRGLDWTFGSIDRQEFENGTELLVAVPICVDEYGRSGRKFKGNAWRYEFSVVTVDFDEHYYRLRCDGKTWGWDETDVEWFIRIR